MEQYTEKKLMEGIYLYERMQPAPIENPPSDVISLEDRMATITQQVNSIQHLIRSNQELNAALEEVYDKDFADAIAENDIVIAKEKQKVLELKQSIFEDFKVSVPLPEFIEECDEGVFL